MPLSLYMVYITILDKLHLNDIVPKLPNALKYKVSKYQLEIDRWRALLSNLLVRKVLQKELNIDPYAIKIEIDNYGKPFLNGRERQFNLSHAGEIIVLVTDDKPVGIDIEYVYPLSEINLLLPVCFSEEEQREFFTKNNEEEQLNFFFELWTLKESYIKALGKGMQHPLRSFSISALGEKALLLKPDSEKDLWHFKRYTFDDRYKCAVCAQHSHFPESATLIPIDELLELL